MKKRIYAVYILVLIIVFGLGCSSGILYYKNYLPESSLNDTISDNNVLISYSEFQEFFSYIKEHIKIEGLKVKYASSQDNYHIIDENWSFGTRSRLLLNNEDYLQPTEEFLILEDNDQNCQLTINICYNNNYIGNDLHYLTSSNSDIKDIDASLTENTNSCMLSYKNLIIGIQQGRKNTDINYLTKSIDEIVKITEDYFIKTSQR